MEILVHTLRAFLIRQSPTKDVFPTLVDSENGIPQADSEAASAFRRDIVSCRRIRTSTHVPLATELPVHI